MHGAAVGFDSLDDLVWLGKAEHCSYICCVSDELCPAAPDILVHGAVLTELVSKVISCLDKGKINSIQLKIDWSACIYVARREDALGLALFRVRVG